MFISKILIQVRQLLVVVSVFGEGLVLMLMLTLIAPSEALESQNSSFDNFCRPLEDYGPR